MENRPDYKLLLVVGYPRSGTTWLTMLLAQHPAVTATLHAALFHALDPLHDWWHTSRPHGKRVVRAEHDVDGSVSRVDLTELLEDAELTGQLRCVTETVFDAVAQRWPQTQVIAEKTPENMELMHWVLEVVPEAYILHIVRDPRSTYASVRRSLARWALPDAFPAGLQNNTMGWCNYIAKGEAVKERIAGRYRRVFYEHLLQDGVSILQELLEWLELEGDEAFCRRALEATEIDKMRGRRLMPEGFFQSGEADSWRRELTTGEVKSIEFLAGDVMAQMGYLRQYPRSDRRPVSLAWHQAAGRAARFLRYRLLDNRLMRQVKQQWRSFRI